MLLFGSHSVPFLLNVVTSFSELSRLNDARLHVRLNDA